MAGALQLLGLKRAVVVYGHGGLDGVSLSGVNQLMVLEDGQLRRDQLDPQALGLALQPIDALAGGDLACNQQILQAVLQGQGSQAAQKDVVALNTALVLWSAGQVNSWADGDPASPWVH